MSDQGMGARLITNFCVAPRCASQCIQSSGMVKLFTLWLRLLSHGLGHEAGEKRLEPADTGRSTPNGKTPNLAVSATRREVIVHWSLLRGPEVWRPLADTRTSIKDIMPNPVVGVKGCGTGREAARLGHADSSVPKRDRFFPAASAGRKWMPSSIPLARAVEGFAALMILTILCSDEAVGQQGLEGAVPSRLDGDLIIKHHLIVFRQNMGLFGL